MRESTIQREVRLEFSKLTRSVLLRYQVGTFIAPQDGSYVHIGEPGVSDLIGIVPHVVTQEDVGRTIGVMVAMEMKTEKGKTQKDRREKQGNFLRRINALGGIAGVVRSVEDMRDLVLRKWDSRVRRNFVD